MAYGVTSKLAHLNKLKMDDRFRPELERLFSDKSTLNEIAPIHDLAKINEIDWSAVKAWKDGDAPSFAGRYFLGTPTQEEIENDLGFCLWAHGEGAASWVIDDEGLDPWTQDSQGSGLWMPRRIVPLQRANDDWQRAEGDKGKKYAELEARAFTNYIQRCLDVGDLAIPHDSAVVLVFLEAAYGLLSSDYWASWSTMIMQSTIQSQSSFNLLLLPAIACWFTLGEEIDDQGNTQTGYWPEFKVRECLNQKAPAGMGNRCYGLWAISPLTNPVFLDFEQNTNTFLGNTNKVPVYYWRSRDETSPVSGGVTDEQLEALLLITIDEVAPDVDDPTKMTFIAQNWDPSAPVPLVEDDTTEELAGLELPGNLPTQCGVDGATKLKGDEPNCFADRNIVVKRLPGGTDWNDRGSYLDGDHEVISPTKFVGRYLYPHTKYLRDDEVNNISQSGLMICSLFQIYVSPLMTDDDPITLDPRNGLRHGAWAFKAAHDLNQPPYTPIYFSVDLSVGSYNGDTHWPGVDSPSLADILTYFYDVRRAYQAYISNEANEIEVPTPYYIGVYGTAKILNAVYRAGLATHFWQSFASSFGPAENFQHNWTKTARGWRAWPHLNAWQVVLENQRIEGNTLPIWNDNTVDECVPGFDGTIKRGVDLNVAWGDPGGWKLFP